MTFHGESYAQAWRAVDVEIRARMRLLVRALLAYVAGPAGGAL